MSLSAAKFFTTGSLVVGDLLVQGIFFLVLAAAAAGVISVGMTSRKKKRQLDRLEEKLDLLIRETHNKER
ncbi:hypothetical protein GLW04_03515 [Halobacillus litoralis]|uniref:DUF4083 domain-containing protein n=1 Tax=Halobacillus litoralis TaxID=45668 RepID=A0A845DNJ8_9BACI|nr:MULTISPECIES: hypothetical protein [Halobacillus]MYL18943.1 hypothetical protein [Halobacillus litoralis]MYL31116.1 hypothetical protein [Halobacillus halophilus]MYL39425.1 hypothetical protein [Halobacillus litoralis]